MGRGKDSSGFVLFVKLARLGRDGDFSSFVLCAQLPRIAGMRRVKMLAVSFSVLCGLGFIGSGGVKIPMDSIYLLSWLGWGAMEILVSFLDG